MGLNDYKCPVCGKTFDYIVTYKSHKSMCGLKRIDEFDDHTGVKSLNVFGKRMDALRKNDYDDSFKPKKSVQKNLRNRIVKQ